MIKEWFELGRTPIILIRVRYILRFFFGLGAGGGLEVSLRLRVISG